MGDETQIRELGLLLCFLILQSFVKEDPPPPNLTILSYEKHQGYGGKLIPFYHLYTSLETFGMVRLLIF